MTPCSQINRRRDQIWRVMRGTFPSRYLSPTVTAISVRSVWPNAGLSLLNSGRLLISSAVRTRSGKVTHDGNLYLTSLAQPVPLYR
jgi:hypothetical protein